MPAALVRAYRVFFALLALAAVGRQLASDLASGASIANFFSFFTIQSNLLAAGALIAVVVWPSGRAEWWRGLALVGMTVTGIVFNLLLRDLDVQPIGWVNDIVHVVMPVAMMLDWITVPPREPIAWRAAFGWLAFPLFWLAYTLARGAATGWYPYPFLDVPKVGATTVALMCLALCVGFIVTVAAARTVGSRGARVVAPRTG